jgi:glycosyltransferase involved in cell wall biosynthesis
VYAGGVPSGDQPRVSYGLFKIPAANEPAVGGIVKLQSLQRLFPHSPRRFNLLYLVTSRLPHDAVSLARAARRKGARLVVNQNGVAYPGWFGAGFERVNAPMRALLGLADHVFYQSEFCKRSADKFLGPTSASCAILYNAVDTETFRPAAAPPAGLTLLLGGSQDLRYRIQTALEALAVVARVRSDVRLVVTGRLRWIADPRAARRDAEDLARALGVRDRVTFLGPYAQADAPRIFQSAHILLHTKYNDPCPAVVIEAMASGLPVAYSHSGGVPELVGDDAGIGVPAPLDWNRDVPPDPAAIAAAVIALADPARYRRASAAARQRAVERFDVQPWLERHRQLFGRLVAG